jgi:hypothetical protein
MHNKMAKKKRKNTHAASADSNKKEQLPNEVMFAIATEVEAFYNEGVLLKQNT